MVSLSEVVDNPAGQALVQAVLNHSAGYVEESFGHSLAGIEGRQLFELLCHDVGARQRRVYSIDLTSQVSRSIGFITLGLDYPDWDGGYIHFLVLDARYRRQGLGRQAVEMLEARWAAKAPKMRLKVYPVDDSALSFWRALGYEVVERCPVSFVPKVGQPHECLFLQKQLQA